MKLKFNNLILFFQRKYYGLVYPKFKYILKKKAFNVKHKILDIGCGGNSPLLTKIIFPFSIYTGIDRDFYYHNNKLSLELIDERIEHDLNKNIEDLKMKIGNAKYDIIIFNHTIEHTFLGLDILDIVSKNLNPNGCIYIEFPSIRSLNFPSMRGTLNFCDDSSHCRIYSVREIANLLLLNKFSIISGGRRFNLTSIFLMPLRLILCIILRKSPAGAFWDILGFADYVFAIKL